MHDCHDVFTLGRCREDHSLRPRVDARGQLLSCGKDPGALQDNVPAKCAPGESSRIAFVDQRAVPLADGEPPLLEADPPPVAAVNRIVAQEIPRLSVGAMSFTATTSSPSVSRAIFSAARPIRPRPLIAMAVIRRSLVSVPLQKSTRSPGSLSGRDRGP